jgi:hypothetical protein
MLSRDTNDISTYSGRACREASGKLLRVWITLSEQEEVINAAEVNPLPPCDVVRAVMVPLEAAEERRDRLH